MSWGHDIKKCVPACVRAAPIEPYYVLTRQPSSSACPTRAGELSEVRQHHAFAPGRGCGLCVGVLVDKRWRPVREQCSVLVDVWTLEEREDVESRGQSEAAYRVHKLEHPRHGAGRGTGRLDLRRSSSLPPTLPAVHPFGELGITCAGDSVLLGQGKFDPTLRSSMLFIASLSCGCSASENVLFCRTFTSGSTGGQAEAWKHVANDVLTSLCNGCSAGGRSATPSHLPAPLVGSSESPLPMSSWQA
ncbi:hypothetical protein FA95DRAFT_1207923 [Auriscalpium vulgare]|uniref:Uncharacterized protein n=1 Tax=Auriscalpium vulgare TaxID=40419 RepID=A0ACB8RUI9_9AGAM|nr:hypothetical protein FA95DRAFT_1207923 [Auriscalpium vulgare]